MARRLIPAFTFPAVPLAATLGKLRAVSNMPEFQKASSCEMVRANACRVS